MREVNTSPPNKLFRHTDITENTEIYCLEGDSDIISEHELHELNE